MKSAVVGGGESKLKLYGLCKYEEAGLNEEDGVPRSGYLDIETNINR